MALVVPNTQAEIAERQTAINSQCRLFDTEDLLAMFDKEVSDIDYRPYIKDQTLTLWPQQSSEIYSTANHVFKFPTSTPEALAKEFVIGMLLTQRQLPNFVRVYGFTRQFPKLPEVDNDDTACLIMQCLNGPELGDFMQTHSFKEFHRVILDFLDGYLRAHQELGFCHYDLHPSNVIVHEGRATMIDFEISRIAFKDGSIGGYDGSHQVFDEGVYVDRANWLYDMFKFFGNLWDDTIPPCLAEDHQTRFQARFSAYPEIINFDLLQPGVLEQMITTVMATSQPFKEHICKIIRYYHQKLLFSKQAGQQCRHFLYHALSYFNPNISNQWLLAIQQNDFRWSTYTTAAGETRTLESFVEHVKRYQSP